MDTNWLEDFLAVLAEGSFSRAAERRAITQSAFSRRIRALEGWVGAPLFDRSTHALRLTEAGQRFRPAAFDMLRQLSAAREDALHAAGRAGRSLHFASTHSLSVTFFPTWLRRMEELAPFDATVQLTADSMVACERLMMEGRVHFLLCHTHPAADWRLDARAFRSVVVGTDVLLPVAAPAVAVRGAAPGVGGLAYAPESGIGRILAATREAGDTQKGEARAFSSHLAVALVGMARDGRGVAWAPHSLVAADLAAGRLARVGDPGHDIAVEVRLFRPRARQSAVAEGFWRRACGDGAEADQASQGRLGR